MTFRHGKRLASSKGKAILEEGSTSLKNSSLKRFFQTLKKERVLIIPKGSSSVFPYPACLRFMRPAIPMHSPASPPFQVPSGLQDSLTITGAILCRLRSGASTCRSVPRNRKREGNTILERTEDVLGIVREEGKEAILQMNRGGHYVHRGERLEEALRYLLSGSEWKGEFSL